MRNEKAALTDFDARHHRRASGAVSLQKGIYHLFILRRQSGADIYTNVLRSYQCAFQMCLTNLLLDFDFSLKALVSGSKFPRRLRELCANPDEPTREYLDPACVITHAVFENHKWHGFRKGHPLYSVAQDALSLCERTVDARHNLLYRPFLIDKGTSLFWNDCPLQDFIEKCPSPEEIERIYRDFLLAVWDWRATDKESRVVADRFIQDIFMVYEDEGSNRPTETLILSYARLLNSNNDLLLRELRDYRNSLLRLGDDRRFSEIILPAEWHVGEV